MARNEKLMSSIDPTEALRTLEAFESQLLRLQQDSSRIVLALDALDLTSPAEDKIDPILQELRGFSEVWKSLFTVWGRIEEVRELAWRSIVPRKVRSSLDAILKSMEDFPPRIQQYEAFVNLRNSVRAFKSSMLILSEFTFRCPKGSTLEKSFKNFIH